jgi:Mg/Co/Ni transporter MgtE
LESTIEQAIRNLDAAAVKIVMVVNPLGQLEGTISDGDIRRGLLRGLTLESPIASVIHRTPMVVVPEMGRELVLQLMVANKLQQIPVVDADRHVMGLHLWDEISSTASRPNIMVIMAGAGSKVPTTLTQLNISAARKHFERFIPSDASSSSSS